MVVRTLPLLLVLACTPKQPPRTELPELAKPGAKPTLPPPAGPVTERFHVFGARGARKNGYFTRTRKPDGELATVFHVLENGRGPHVEATLRLAPGDLTPASFTATGKHTMGTKVAETFTRSGNRVEWKSEEEQGDRTLTGPAFFIPIADGPFADLLVTAGRKAGNRIALLPAGQAAIENVGTLEVTSGSNKKTLTGYAIRGIHVSPKYTWFDGDRWFGEFSSWQSIVTEGWEAAIPQVVNHQEALSRAAHAQLAKANRHVPPAAGLALTHASVLDIAKGTWLPDQTILIVGETIKAIGPKLAIPPGAEVIDLTGKRVIPGLIDMHGHLGAEDGVLDIASGVTTVRDVGNDPDELDDLKKRWDDGTAIGPTIIRYGFIEGRNEKAASSVVTAETVDEAKAAVEYYAKRGYEGIKIYNSVKTELVPVLAKEAHARNMRVIGHVPVKMVANEAVRAGYDGLEHINQMMLNFFATKDTDTRDTTRFTLVGDKMPDFDLDGKPMREFIELLKKNKTVLDPTLAVFEDLYAGVPGKITAGMEDTVARMPVQLARQWLTGGLPLEGNKRELYARAWDKLLAAIKVMWKAKLHLVAGTDHVAGLMLHREIELFGKAGLPAIDALRTATTEAARGLQLDTKIGSIAAGKRADLAILSGDVLADLRQLRTIERTVRGGVVFTSAPLYASVGVKP
jgi:imidazolonepropionase-like amidohydrolase